MTAGPIDDVGMESQHMPMGRGRCEMRTAAGSLDASTALDST
jgi:hypothetical protein